MGQGPDIRKARRYAVEIGASPRPWMRCPCKFLCTRPNWAGSNGAKYKNQILDPDRGVNKRKGTPINLYRQNGKFY